MMKTQIQKRKQEAYTLIELMVAFGLGFSVVMGIAILCVIIHFIMKFW